MSVPRGFGTPQRRDGKSAKGIYSTEVPLVMLNEIATRPLPVTIGGSNNVTFTLKGSTRHIAFWLDNDLFYLDKDLAYTWAAANTILDSTGAQVAQTNSVLGVWYIYATINSDGSLALFPSQTAPEDTAGQFGSYLGHPGTARTQAYRYVGCMWCTTAATPAFLTAVKIGFDWHFASLTAAPVTPAYTVTSVFTVRLPKLAKFGGRVAGSLTCGKVGKITVGASSVASQGVVIGGAATVVSAAVVTPFDIPGPNDTSGELWAIAVVSSGATISVTRWHDVV